MDGEQLTEARLSSHSDKPFYFTYWISNIKFKAQELIEHLPCLPKTQSGKEQ